MYGLPASMSKTEMRAAIYRERYLEFPFEGKRFWDLRRTRRLSEIDSLTKHGLLAQLKPGLDPTDRTKVFTPSDFTYSVSDLIVNGPKTMFVPDTYYFFPISQGEIEKNPKLEQNKAWGGNFDPTLQ